MKYEIENIDNVTKKIVITFEKNDVDLKKEEEGVLEKYLKNISLKGFRKGQIPKEVIKNKFAQQMVEEVVIKLLDKYYHVIIEESKLNPVSRPNIEIIKNQNESLVIGLEIKIYVVEEIAQYKKLKIEIEDVKKHSNLNQEVEDKIESIFRTYSEVSGDAKTLEKNDLFATTSGFESYENMKIEIEKKIKANYEEDEKNIFTDKIIEKLISESKILLPNVLIDNEAKKHKQNLINKLESHNMAMDIYSSLIGKNEEEINEEMKDIAEKNIKTQLILEQISKNEGIKVEPEEIEYGIKDLVERMSIKYKTSFVDMGNKIKKQDNYDALKSDIENQIKATKTLDFLANITEKIITTEVEPKE